LAALRLRVLLADVSYDRAKPRIATALRDWEAAVNRDEVPEWDYSEGQLLRVSLEDVEGFQAKGNEPQLCAGRRGQARSFDGSSWLEAGDVANFGYFDKFSLAAWIRPDGDAGGTIVSRMTDVEEGDGYSLVLRDGKLHVLLVKRWLDDALRVETAEAVIAAAKWQHVLMTYDGSRRAAGIRVYIDGEPVPLKSNLDAINQTFAAKDQPLRIGAGGGPKSRFRGAIDEVQIFRSRRASSVFTNPNF
jgi:hypothetical protein